jgi:hypothetical protein
VIFSKNRNITFVLILLTAIIIILMFIPYKQALVFLQVEKNDELSYVPISTGETFKIKYKHSIHLSDVIESYKVTKQNEIQQYELEYEEFAVGMPADASEGEAFEIKDGKFYIKNMQREFPSFILRIGQVRANHTLIHQDGSYPLSSYHEPGSRVLIQVKKLSFIQQLKGVNILDDK